MDREFDGIPELDAAGLRGFGLTMAAAVALVFGAVLPLVFNYSIPAWPFALACVLVAWALLAPRTLKFVYRPWMKLGLLLNRITSPIIMGAVFFLLITPVSLIMKLIRRDPLARGFDELAETYRKPSRKPPRESLERPF